MRARTIVSVAVIAGGAIAALLTRQLLRRRRNREAANSLDGDEPIEAILVYDDSVDLDDLDDLTARADAAVIAQAELVVDPMLVMTTVEEVTDPSVLDSGELYYSQRAHLDDDRAQAHGENWIEALQEESVEYGPEPESVLVFLDEAEFDSAPTETRDRPIADRGSAGPRGL